jgi:hypothetical protein
LLQDAVLFGQMLCGCYLGLVVNGYGMATLSGFLFQLVLSLDQLGQACSIPGDAVSQCADLFLRLSLLIHSRTAFFLMGLQLSAQHFNPVASGCQLRLQLCEKGLAFIHERLGCLEIGTKALGLAQQIFALGGQQSGALFTDGQIALYDFGFVVQAAALPMPLTQLHSQFTSPGAHLDDLVVCGFQSSDLGIKGLLALVVALANLAEVLLSLSPAIAVPGA